MAGMGPSLPPTGVRRTVRTGATGSDADRRPRRTAAPRGRARTLDGMNPELSRRHPDVQRGGRPAPARRPAAPRARRPSARRTRSSPSTTAARTSPPRSCSGCTASGPQLRVVRLRANAGHQAAISAGLVERARRLRRDHRRRPAGPARGDRRDAGAGPATRARRRLRRAHRPLSRHRLQADHRPRLLPRHPAPRRDERAERRRRLPADVAGPRSTRSTALPEHNRVLRFIVPALGFPSAHGGVPPRGAGRGRLEVPASSRWSGCRSTRVTGFSMAPLRLATLLGIGGGVLAVLLGIFAHHRERRGQGRRRLDLDRRHRRRPSAPPSCCASGCSASTSAACTPRCRAARPTSSPTTRCAPPRGDGADRHAPAPRTTDRRGGAGGAHPDPRTPPSPEGPGAPPASARGRAVTSRLTPGSCLTGR